MVYSETTDKNLLSHSERVCSCLANTRTRQTCNIPYFVNMFRARDYIEYLCSNHQYEMDRRSSDLSSPFRPSGGALWPQVPAGNPGCASAEGEQLELRAATTHYDGSCSQVAAPTFRFILASTVDMVLEATE